MDAVEEAHVGVVAVRVHGCGVCRANAPGARGRGGRGGRSSRRPPRSATASLSPTPTDDRYRRGRARSGGARRGSYSPPAQEAHGPTEGVLEGHALEPLHGAWAAVRLFRGSSSACAQEMKM